MSAAPENREAALTGDAHASAEGLHDGEGVFFGHPSPGFEQIVQVVLIGVTIALIAVIVVQIPLMIAGMPWVLALLVITTCLGLIPFTLLPIVSAPPVTVTADGLWMQPRFLARRFIAWSEVTAVKPYPLVPSPGSENTRKLLVGRKKYQPMQGVMLIVPSLPALYRVHGLLVSEGWTGVIALTNRTHTDYPRLLSLVPGAEAGADGVGG